MSLIINPQDAEQFAVLSRLQLSEDERARLLYFVSDGAATGPVIGGIHRDQLEALYQRIGYLAVLDAAGGRGMDFARNQRQGAWAEGLLKSYAGCVQFVEFGLSDPISPDDANYGTVRRKHRDIELREGKRPDFLLFPTSIVAANPRILNWHKRRIGPQEAALLSSSALCGIEVKSSMFHFGLRESLRRTDSSVSAVSITLKDEELSSLLAWQNDSGVPMVIVQVFVDSIHACALSHFLSRKAAGATRSSTDQKTGKLTYFLPIESRGWLLAKIKTESDFLFETTSRGSVAEPREWPTASLENFELGALARTEPAIQTRIQTIESSSKADLAG